MYRSLILGVALALFAPVDLGRAANAQYNIEIVAIDLAGRQANLTQDPALDVAPAVASDGRIAFFSSRDGSGDLYVMHGAGGNARRLTDGAVDNSGVALAEDLAWSQASWSPYGDKVAFDGKYMAIGPPCAQHCEGWDVLVIGADGSGLAQVALDARAPAWSPDGRSLAYESDYDAYDGSARSVTILHLDGSGSVRVKAFNTEGDVGPVWSKHGGKLAFQARPAVNSPTSIYTVRADGSGVRRLARGHNPTWSHDGRRLAFVDDHRLFAINTDGTHTRKLSRTGEFVVDAAWSPTGGTLAYVAGTKPAPGGAAHLRVETVSADGKRVHVLARQSAATLIWGSPVWTPDGKRILVAIERHS